MMQHELASPLDFYMVTSLYLYGTPTSPPELFDRIAKRDARNVEINIDASSFMGSGPGQYFCEGSGARISKFQKLAT